MRHESCRRTLSVVSREYLTPNMLRIVLGGDELAGFNSPSADDHIKLHIPGGQDGEESRDFTPRAYDSEKQELTLDIAVHASGPAMKWAQSAAPGDHVDISGPRKSSMVPDDFDWWLLIGDETALPAIARRIENLPEGIDVISVVTVCSQRDIQNVKTRAHHHPVWIIRDEHTSTDHDEIISRLNQLTLPEGEGYVWIAAEARTARGLRNYCQQVMDHHQDWMRATGYWVKGRADAYEKF